MSTEFGKYPEVKVYTTGKTLHWNNELRIIDFVIAEDYGEFVTRRTYCLQGRVLGGEWAPLFTGGKSKMRKHLAAHPMYIIEF